MRHKTTTFYLPINHVRPLKVWFQYTKGREDFENCTEIEYNEFSLQFEGSYDSHKEIIDDRNTYNSSYQYLKNEFGPYIDYKAMIDNLVRENEITVLRGADPKFHVFKGKLDYTDLTHTAAPAPDPDWNDEHYSITDADIEKFNENLRTVTNESEINHDFEPEGMFPYDGDGNNFNPDLTAKE